MTDSVAELTTAIYWFSFAGATLVLLYGLMVWLARRARRHYKAHMQEMERSLIGARVLVIKTIAPPEAGEIVTLQTGAAASHRAHARTVLWAGQRARVVDTTDDGYMVAPLKRTERRPIETNK